MAGNNMGNDRAARREREATFLGRLLADPWRKLVAIGLGLLCWFGLRLTLKKDVASQHWFTVRNVHVHVPAAALNGPDRYYFAQGGASVTSVSLDVAVDFWHQGTEIKPDEFRVELPMEALAFEDDGRRTEPLRHEYTLVENDIREKPSTVKLRSIDPKTITLRWDKYVSREIPVHANIKNWLPGNRTAQTQVEPSVVTVTGPAFMVNQITAVQTAEFDLRNDQDFDMELELLPPAFAECTLGIQQVMLKVKVRNNAEVISRRFDNIRVNILNRLDATFEADRNSVVSDQVSVIVSGPADSVNGIAESGLGAYCDLTSFSSSGIQNVKVQLLGLPPGVKAAIEPSEFLRLKMVPIYSSQNAAAPPAPEGDAKSHAGGVVAP